MDESAEVDHSPPTAAERAVESPDISVSILLKSTAGTATGSPMAVHAEVAGFRPAS